MQLSFNKKKQKGIIPAILALILGIGSIIVLVLVLALIVYLNHIIAGLIGGGDQPAGNSNYGVGNCATTQTLDGVTLPKAKGPLSSEQHLATTAEKFPSGWPTSTHDQDERHYQVTNFSINCSGCPKQGFTPSEGGGNIGGGTGSKPSPDIEPWLINVLKDLPKNSKVLVHSTKTNKTVVTIGGYEKGPGDPSFAGGARDEVLHALGIEHMGEVEIGFAQDQSLMHGPIQCVSEVNNSSGTGYNNVPLFKQCDPRWGKNDYDCPTNQIGKTICSSGCGVTSAAMVLKFYGKNVDPAKMAKDSIAFDDRPCGQGTSAEFFSDIAQKYNLKYKSVNNFEEAMRDLKAGKPVIAGTSLTSKGHYVVLTGINNEGLIMVNDPMAGGIPSATQTKIRSVWKHGHLIEP